MDYTPHVCLGNSHCTLKLGRQLCVVYINAVLVKEQILENYARNVE